MPIIGFSLQSFSGEKGKNVPSGEIKVNSTPTITAVSEVELPNTTKRKGLDITFEFKTDYEPDIGTIAVKGNLLYVAEKNKEAIDMWKDKKALPESMYVEVLNYLFRRCLVKITTLADDLQLPPPVALPRAQVKQEGKDKTQDTSYVG